MTSAWTRDERTTGVRVGRRSDALRSLRTLGVAAIAGVGTGVVVAGLGGRLVMKLIALAAGPSAIGRVTANGNIVGELTFAGTLSIIIFSGILFGIIGGLLYAAVRPWLSGLGRWRGVVFGVVVLALMGHLVFEASNFDFRVFGATGLNVGLFAGLFILYGLVIAPVFDVIEGAAARYRPVSLIVWLAALPAAGLIVLAVASSVAGALGQIPDFHATLGVLVLGSLLAGAGGRVIGVGRPASFAMIAIPVIVGGFITGNELAHILFG